MHVGGMDKVTTTIKEALQVFMEYAEQMEDALKLLREAVKEQGSDSIQHYINEENFEKANEIIKELNEFTNMEFDSNAQQIYGFAERIINSQSDIPHKAKAKAIPSVSVIKPSRILGPKENELIKTIGYTSLSRLTDATEQFEEDVLYSLLDKEYIDGEDVEIAGEKVFIFELSETGKKEFEQTYGIEPNESLKSQLIKKYSSLSLGFFLFDVENALQERNYQVNEIGVHQIEVLKDKRYTYLTPDLGQFTENDYFKVLNRKNQLKNIGFVSINEESMENAKNATQKWAKKNQEKCKFLTVHFTTPQKMEQSPKIFDTLRF